MDVKERIEALSTASSFIVQAPAGSGKTELLTQRFLALLATVSEPEQILALTFTRKAAQEMRHRILQALLDAEENRPLKSKHQEATRALATAALEKNAQLSWSILQHPHRLRITTFDSFCLEIYQSIPQAEQVILPNLTNYPYLCYRPAIHNWFNWCRENEELHEPLKILLKPVQNQPEKLYAYLIQLLECRDQWLDSIQHHTHLSDKEHLKLLESIIQSHWTIWETCLPDALQVELIALIHELNPYLPKERFANLETWADFSNIDFKQIQELVELLMTKDLEFRKGLNHYVGLTDKVCPKDLLKGLQIKAKALLEELDNHPDFKFALQHLPQFPNPDDLSLDWNLLSAYYQLLPLLVAHLHLEFEKQECCDFIYVALQAQLSLDESDYHLYLDNQLHHLLIDEFQDTSWSQLQFIQKLTQDWDQYPHKTLFLVGDPMQSIYRFRSADVGIFLQIQQHGLKPLQLHPLYLKQNFRSTPNLIEPLNQYFSAIFPQKEQIHLGGVPFHHAHPALLPEERSFIAAEYFESTPAQTQKIIEIIQDAKQQHIKSVAILVRSRNQLKPILEALEHQHIHYQGLDLIPLGKLPHIRDIWNLTQLLLNPGDRITELAVLRCPFIGLKLDEIHTLANLSPKKSIFQILDKEEHLANLNIDSQTRLRHFYFFLEQAKQHIHQQPFTQVLQNFLHQLHVQDLLNASEQLDLEKFYTIIELFCREFACPDITDIQTYLNHHFISAHQAFELQIMTIHKSKGLEFDWVILPNLGDMPRPTKLKPLTWYPLPNPDSKLDGIFITSQSNSDQHLQNTKLCRWFEKQQEYYENQRLCYVALTRAKSRLYLLDDKTKAQSNSFRDFFNPNLFLPGQLNDLPSKVSIKQTNQVKRLPSELFRAALPAPMTPKFNKRLNFHDSFRVKQIGIITHRVLQWICQFHPEQETDIPWNIAENLLKEFTNLEPSLTQIKDYIHRFWHCPIGQWIKVAHQDEQNEFELLIKDNNILRQAILDRTFIADSKRWIIDFKTSIDDEHAKTSYEIQLNRYAAAIETLYPNQRIHCGVYYLSNLHWQTWAYQKQAALETLY
jgi:superfamily I DNA/RNA helicase